MFCKASLALLYPRSFFSGASTSAKRKNRCRVSSKVSPSITFVTLNVNAVAAKKSGEKIYKDLYVCAMHPWNASEGPADCNICGMAMSKVENFKSGSPLPKIDQLYVSESDPLYVHYGKGKYSEDGSELIPITKSPHYEPREETSASSEMDMKSSSEMSGMKAEAGTQLWTCGMHPEVISDKPGICPICHMDLIPLKNSTSGGSGSIIQIDPTTIQNIGVVTENVEKRNLSRLIMTNGVVKSAEDREYLVNSKINGWVENLYVNRTGDSVKKGQPLLEIYSPELVSAQQEFLLALDSEAKGARPEQSELVKSAERRLQLWDISDEQIQKLKETRQVNQTMTITSPADGIVTMKKVVDGSAIKAGMDLFQIIDYNKMWVIAQIFESELPWIRVGDKVVIKSSYDPMLEKSGKIDFIYPQVDTKSRSVDVRVIVNNSGLQLLPEMYVDAEISVDQKKGVVAVPKSAVIRGGKRNVVFVSLGEGKFEPREIHLGMETDDYYEVLHNLHAGEQVVTSAQFLLDSEAKLQEAIQKRLRLMKDSGKTEMDNSTSGHSGHIH